MLALSLAGLALALALTHPWSHGYVGEMQYGDAAYWDLTGESWARGYVSSKVPDIRPGYSVFLGIIYSLFRPDFAYAFVGQSLVYSVGVAMLYLMGTHLGGRLAGLLAAALFALNPYMWEWNATATTELLGSIANLAALYFLADGLRQGRRFRSLVFFGVFLAFANVIRPLTLSFLGPSLLVLLFLVRASWKQRAARTLVALAATMLGLMPGVLYQYISTGDPGLSSNSAANLFAASHPTYRTWSPAVYEYIEAELRQRGVQPTIENVNAEFSRQTLQNYVKYPWFQVERIATGFSMYMQFEGEIERPMIYTFYRPYVLMAFVVIVSLLVLAVRMKVRLWAPAVALVFLIGLVWSPLQTLVVAQALGLVAAAAFIWRRGARQLGLLAVALYWIVTGLAAILTTGLVGFFVNRLYTQVEPARCLLIALGVTYLIGVLVPNPLSRGRLLELRPLVRASPRLPGAARVALTSVAVAFGVVLAFGAVRLAAANILPPENPEAIPSPDARELAELARALSLPGPLIYVDAIGFDAARIRLLSGALPADDISYALPGQFTRFLWYVSDQDRTIYWFVYSDRPRPPSLDRTLLLGESSGRLLSADFRDRFGLLIVTPTSSYWGGGGDPTQNNHLPTRAFVPWDPATGRIQWESDIVFPLNTTLYDDKRFEAAHREGRVVPSGPQKVRLEDRLLRALSFQPDSPLGDQERQAAISYRGLWMGPGAQFQAWVALHPRFFGREQVGKLRAELYVRAGDREMLIAGHDLDPSNREQWIYTPWNVDLSGYAGQRADLTIQVRGSSAVTETAEVLIGEPRLIMP